MVVFIFYIGLLDGSVYILLFMLFFSLASEVKEWFCSH